jgi:cytidylate kinase
MTEGERMAPVLAVDGPGGSGKGTICRQVAGAMGWHLLDSGALYRAVAVHAGHQGVSLDDADGLAALAAALPVDFEPAEDDTRVLLDGADVSREIRAETTGDKASRVAAIPAVRAALSQRQRDFRRPPGLVADGRDMGTVIFPDAEAKVFLTASPAERARRRHKQLVEKGIDANIDRLYGEIVERDRRDEQREVAPLKPAPDARVIDTTAMSIPEVVETVIAFLRSVLSARDETR